MKLCQTDFVQAIESIGEGIQEVVFAEIIFTGVGFLEEGDEEIGNHHGDQEEVGKKGGDKADNIEKTDVNFIEETKGDEEGKDDSDAVGETDLTFDDGDVGHHLLRGVGSDETATVENHDDGRSNEGYKGGRNQEVLGLGCNDESDAEEQRVERSDDQSHPTGHL